MKRMGQELGEDAGPELDQAIEEMESGGAEPDSRGENGHSGSSEAAALSPGAPANHSDRLSR